MTSLVKQSQETVDISMIKTDGLKICCVGAGYVGGPTMTMIALKCPQIEVNVVDLSQPRIDAWNSDDLPIYEPGLFEAVKEARGRNLFFSTSVEQKIGEADIIFVAVNTPTKTTGVGKGVAANVRNVELVARTIAKVCKDGNMSKIVVEKSTVPVKTAETIRRVLTANSAHPEQFQILSNPEFLAEGTAMRDLETPDRVLIGGLETAEGIKAAATLTAVYAQWIPRERILNTNMWSSELSKLVANAFLAQRISSINAISELCEATGADVNEVSKAIGTDSRIGPKFLRASVGFGGSCFQKDILNLVYLCRTYGLTQSADYWEQVIVQNDHQKKRFAHNMLKKMFNTVSGKKIAMFGFAFKKNTGDTRETAAAYICKDLLEEGAQVKIYDPQVKLEDLLMEFKYTLGITPENTPNFSKCIELVKTPEEATDGAHAIAVITEWDCFKDYNYAKIYESMQKPAFIFDGRNILDMPKLKDIGFEVYGIGKTY